MCEYCKNLFFLDLGYLLTFDGNKYQTPNVGIGICVQRHITMHTYRVCPQIMNRSIMGSL
jgi:hypothetical protein